MAPHFILEELQTDFELILVDRKTDAHKAADYLALNPAGRIPTLVDGQQVIFESAAICIHLAETHPARMLIPQIGDHNRATCLQWIMYLTNTVQAELMLYFYPQRHSIDSSHASVMVAAQEIRLTDMFALLDAQLETQKFLAGEQLSICDFYLFMLAIWADELKQPPLSFEYLGKYLRRLAKRESIINVCKKENLSLFDYQ